MQRNLQRSLFVACLGVAGCVSAGTNADSTATTRTYAGWYVEHATERLFYPCGQAQPWLATSTSDLERRAKTFGLDQDTPVYVRVTGVVQGQAIAVSRVDQFGAAQPVRDCALTGMVTPPER